VQSVPITNKVVSSNTVNGEVYSIQQYVIKFVMVSSTIKTDSHDITEILLKVALNTINQPINLNQRKANIQKVETSVKFYMSV
jgi:hypothetical protein